MATMTYKEQLLHPNWQRKRLETLERHNFQCASCEGTEKTLHVHHRKYVKGRMAWEYEADQLTVLCEDCHAREHGYRELLERLIAEADWCRDVGWVVGFLAGHLDADCAISDGNLAKAGFAADPNAYDLGVLASIADGVGWEKLFQASQILKARVNTPVQESVMARWGEETGKP